MRAPWSALLILFASGCSKTHDAEGHQVTAGATPSLQESVLRAAHITASSEHMPNPGHTFVATNLIDGALNTSWQPASSDQASENWVRLNFDGDVTVRRYLAEALAVGGLAAGGAAVWLYLHDGQRERQAAADVSVHVVPTVTGLAVLGGFELQHGARGCPSRRRQ